MKSFLDLSYTISRTTVKRSYAGLAALDNDMNNVHAAGEKKMMKAQMEESLPELQPGSERPQINSVTQLTSKPRQGSYAHWNSLIEVLYYKVWITIPHINPRDSGFKMGLFCSALEARLIKRTTTSNFFMRHTGKSIKCADKEIKKRIATPIFAKKRSKYIVVGRPITLAATR